MDNRHDCNKGIGSNWGLMPFSPICARKTFGVLGWPIRLRSDSNPPPPNAIKSRFCRVSERERKRVDHCLLLCERSWSVSDPSPGLTRGISFRLGGISAPPQHTLTPSPPMSSSRISSITHMQVISRDLWAYRHSPKGLGHAK